MADFSCKVWFGLMVIDIFCQALIKVHEFGKSVKTKVISTK